MNPDDLKQTWQAQTGQTRLTIDADLLLKEVQRSQRLFSAILFWRDVREVGIALVLVPLWVFLGTWSAQPWTWYLTVPVLLWIAGFMLVHQRLHNRQPPNLGEPLRQRVESSLAQVDHQIWLLRNVFWWYLLPMALSILAFFAQITWRTWSGGWVSAVAAAVAVAVLVLVCAGLHWLNQYAVRCELEPRVQELQALLASLKDEVIGVGRAD